LLCERANEAGASDGAGLDPCWKWRLPRDALRAHHGFVFVRCRY
jgi:hypothetical protein